MRTPPSPEPAGRRSSSRHPAGGPPAAPPAPGSSDDAPTIITSARGGLPADPTLGLAVGSRLGHFEVIDTIGAGGMAAVLKARDLELNRVVALKILPPRMARDPELVARFKQEARAAAQLHHENVAGVFFCGEDAGLHFIAFEFVEGENLRVLIERRGALPPAECVRYMLQVAAGLAHAAERGVVHRDIKPSNIIITPDGRAKIVDMGLARNLDQPADGGVTQSGVTLGTFDYISPEQALDPRRADARSDIYSLGCAFYHALTGRPPVPEGTPAKKLFAHQHEPVLDPRVINPAVPDELAAVLAKMMAKDPARRYQTPAELIAALSVLARKFNLAADALPGLDPALLPPDPSAVQLLPQPPRVPVGLAVGLAAVAAAAVVLIALAVGPGDSGAAGNQTGQPQRPWEDPPPGPKGAAGDLTLSPGPRPPAAPPGVVGTAEELAKALQSAGAAEVRLAPGKRYDLTDLKAGVVFKGKRLLLRGDALNPPTVRVAAAPATDARMGDPPPGTLAVVGAERVEFHGVWFEVTAGPPDDEQPARRAGVLVLDAGRLELDGCRFTADGRESADAAGLEVRTRDGAASATAVAARNCYFGPRLVAAQFAGRVQAEFAESAFAPHLPVFALGGDPESAGGEPSALALRHCTFLLDQGAVAEAERGVRWDVTAGYCVFAAAPPDPAAMMTTPAQAQRRPALLQAAGDPPAARFSGRANEPNAYYRTDAYFPTDQPAATARGYSFDECRERWGEAPPAADAAAAELKLAPWVAADPRAELDPPPEPGRTEPEWWKAFRLKTTLPQLQVGDPRERPLGARFLPSRDRNRLYPYWPPPSQESAAERAVKVWWPDMPAGAAPAANVFPTLEQAIAAANPGDELHVRHNGPLEVPQQILSKPKLRLTMKPEPGYSPVLTPAVSNLYEPCLFKLADGEELTLDGLEVRLRPRAKKGDVRSQSVVTVVAGRQCTLLNCVVTAEPQYDEKLAAVILTDPDGEMRTEADRRPRVTLKNCLVRGTGRAVWVQAARPCDVEMTNTVTALAGPVLDVDPAAKPPPAGATTRVTLDRVTAALAGPLLDLRPGRKPPGWVPVEVVAGRCVFAPAEVGQPLALIDGGDPATPEQTFTWIPSADGPNWYANFPAGAAFLTVVPADDTGETKLLMADQWFTFTGEKADRSAVTATFARPPAAKRLAAVKPADVAVESVDAAGADPGAAGADVKQVAKPGEER